MQTTQLILIRHGHTTSNSAGEDAVLSGRTDVPLSARGRGEAERLREHLRALPPFDAIYSSPLQRARDTAAVIAGAEADTIQLCDGLQEIDCGVLDGRPLDEVQQRYPELWAANLRQDDERFRWPEGESYREFRCRCLRAVRRVAHRHRGQRVALVTHAGVVGQLLGALEGVSPARWEHRRPSNTAITELEWARGAARLLRFDDLAHLARQTPADAR